MQRSGSRLQDQRSEETQIKTLAEPSPPLTAERNNRPKEKRATPSRRSTALLSAIKTDCVITVSGRRGSADPAGLGRGRRDGCCPYLSNALQRKTSSPSNSSLLAFTKFSTSAFPALPHTHTVRKC